MKLCLKYSRLFLHGVVSRAVCPFYCRSWVIFHWRWWRLYSCGLSWFCTWLERPEVLRDKRLLCYPRCAGAGIRLWLAGRNPRLANGREISWRSGLKVSIITHIMAGISCYNHFTSAVTQQAMQALVFLQQTLKNRTRNETELLLHIYKKNLICSR